MFWFQNIGAINIRKMFDAHKNSQLEKRILSKNKQKMDRIYNLDEKIELIAATKQEEELENLYPAGKDTLDIFEDNSL